MKDKNLNRLSRRQQAELDDALAALIASTKRTTRKLNLIEVSEKLSVARMRLGSLKAVASAVGLSSEMLRQFARVETLSRSVKRLIKEGKLSSVDIADRISRLPKQDQVFVAEKVASGELDSGDVRAVLAYRKTAPPLPIRKVVHDVLASKNIREYVVEFRMPEDTSARAVRSRLVSFFKKDGIHSIKFKNLIGQACVTEQGRQRLEKVRKKRGLPKRKLLDLILSGEESG